MIAIKPLFALLLAYSLRCVFTESSSEFTYTLDDGYPMGKEMFGSITAVDVDKEGNIIVFHRGSHIWDSRTFDKDDVYQLRKDSPIEEDTVITIDRNGKDILYTWGKNLFFMPHGLSLDSTNEYVWLTDVALHQVFKFPVKGTKPLISLGTPFVPGNDESHFCKPTSVADTGEFIFVADGYCNSRIVMFTSTGTYLGEFGQSSDSYMPNAASNYPTFNIPHKIIYAKEAKKLCVADRENGRIQFFSFNPKHRSLSSRSNGLILNKAIQFEYPIADPAFNGRVFSIDYSPVKGGIIVAISGQSLFDLNKTPIGFVYNMTTGARISRFLPPAGSTFGMAHDIAFADDDAESLYVVDVSPVNLWKFSRPIIKQTRRKALEQPKAAQINLAEAISLDSVTESKHSFVTYLFVLSILATIVFVVTKVRRSDLKRRNSSSIGSLYSNSYPTSINSLFGNNARFHRISNSGRTNALLSSMFSRGSLFNMFGRANPHENDFSRIPLGESDNSDDDKSDSDVEEFNINQTTPNIKIDV